MSKRGRKNEPKKEQFDEYDFQEPTVEYIDPPYVRFEGTELEQETMFIADPYGNAMEIKTMKNPDTLWKINK